MQKYKNMMCEFMLYNDETIEDFFVMSETSQKVIGIKKGDESIRAIDKISIVEEGIKKPSFNSSIELRSGKLYVNIAIINDLEDKVMIVKKEGDFPIIISKNTITNLF